MRRELAFLAHLASSFPSVQPPGRARRRPSRWARGQSLEPGAPGTSRAGPDFWRSSLAAGAAGLDGALASANSHRRHPKEPFGITLHVKPVSSPPIIIGIESERRRKKREGRGESDFSSLSGSGRPLDAGGIFWDGERLWTANRGGSEERASITSVSAELQRLAPALWLEAFAHPSRPIRLPGRGLLEPGEQGKRYLIGRRPPGTAALIGGKQLVSCACRGSCSCRRSKTNAETCACRFSRHGVIKTAEAVWESGSVLLYEQTFTQELICF